MQSISSYSSCFGFSEIMENWSPNVTGYGQVAIATTLFFSCAYFYHWYNKESYVDQLFSQRITSVTPSVIDSEPTKKDLIEQHFRNKGYHHLAAVQERKNLSTPLQQIDQYVKNPRQFDKAVAEFAKFVMENCKENLCQFGYEVMPSFFHRDNWKNLSPIYLALSTAQVGDYDSFPLYIEGGEGKIGIKPICIKNPDSLLSTNDSASVNAREVVLSILGEKNGDSFIDELFMFFPFHKELILKVRKKVYPSVSFDDQALNEKVKAQVEILKTFSKGHSLITKKK